MLGLALSFGCSSSTEEIDLSPYSKGEGGAQVLVYYQKTLGTGEAVNERYNGSLVHIWNADGRDFDVDKSYSNIIEGYLYDRISDKSYKPVVTKLGIDSFIKTLKVGKYFIYINTLKPESFYRGVPTYGYTYKYFEVKEKDIVTLKKVFDIKKGEGPNKKLFPWE